MAKKLYVGNLSYDTTDSDLREMFEEHGTVDSAQVIMERDSGRSKGFGFVEMSSDQEAQAAINALNGQEVGGRALTVNEAKPREDRGGGRGGYGGGGGGGGGRGRGGQRRWRWWWRRRRRRWWWRRQTLLGNLCRQIPYPTNGPAGLSKTVFSQFGTKGNGSCHSEVSCPPDILKDREGFHKDSRPSGAGHSNRAVARSGWRPCRFVLLSSKIVEVFTKTRDHREQAIPTER